MMKRDERRIGSGCAGALMLGLALSAWADAPPGRYTVATDTVLDTKTNLTWQRNAPAAGYDWAAATTYCQNLNLGGTGWRLPRVKELQSLVDVSRYGPAIDTTAFPGTPSNWFWSSSPVAVTTSLAWVVVFSNGFTSTGNLASTSQVRCVR